MTAPATQTVTSPEWQRFVALVTQATLSKARTLTEPEHDSLRLGHPFYDRDSEASHAQR